MPREGGEEKREEAAVEACEAIRWSEGAKMDDVAVADDDDVVDIEVLEACGERTSALLAMRTRGTATCEAGAAPSSIAETSQPNCGRVSIYSLRMQ